MELAFDPKIATPDAAAKEGSGRGGNSSLQQLCQDFEAILIHSMFREMRETIPKDGYLEPSHGSEWFRDMMDMEVARDMARRQGLGLAEQLYEQFQNNSGTYKNSA
ncbi:MAG: rod-binding protein [Desulfosalsimonadaceae bacterium]